MKLPYRKDVFISRNKLTKYILSEKHAIGRFKAKFFRNLGFDETNVDFFEDSLRSLVEFEDIKEKLFSAYGTKYIIDGKIDAPNGKTVKVRTIWILEKGQKRPRFITIYPV